jgi:hypothetical protein
MMTMKYKTKPHLLCALALSSILVTSFIAVVSQFEQKALAQNPSSNPLGKVPVIGKLMGGNTTNTTSSKSGANATSGNQSSNPLSNVPIIGKILGGK